MTLENERETQNPEAESQNTEIRPLDLPTDIKTTLESYKESHGSIIEDESQKAYQEAAESQLNQLFLGEDNRGLPEDHLAAIATIYRARAFENREAEGGNPRLENSIQATEAAFRAVNERVFGDVERPEISVATFKRIKGIFDEQESPSGENIPQSIGEDIMDDDIDKNPEKILVAAKELRNYLPDKLDAAVFEKLYGPGKLEGDGSEQIKSQMADMLKAVYELELFIEGLQEKIRKDEEDKKLAAQREEIDKL